MNIDHPAVQEMAARKMPTLTSEFRKKDPALYKRMISFLYFDPEATEDVRKALQVKPTSEQMRVQADRRKSMETYNYLQGDNYESR